VRGRKKNSHEEKKTLNEVSLEIINKEDVVGVRL